VEGIGYCLELIAVPALAWREWVNRWNPVSVVSLEIRSKNLWIRIRNATHRTLPCLDCYFERSAWVRFRLPLRMSMESYGCKMFISLNDCIQFLENIKIPLRRNTAALSRNRLEVNTYRLSH
jgi:hypothetical protein